jgi:hypothetical protein
MGSAIGSRKLTVSAPKILHPGVRTLVRVLLSGGGNETLRNVRLKLTVPHGWEVLPLGSVSRGALLPDAAFTAKFMVTPPVGVVTQYVTLYGSAKLSYRNCAHGNVHCGDDRDGAVTVLLKP